MLQWRSVGECTIKEEIKSPHLIVISLHFFIESISFFMVDVIMVTARAEVFHNIFSVSILG